MRNIGVDTDEAEHTRSVSSKPLHSLGIERSGVVREPPILATLTKPRLGGSLGAFLAHRLSLSFVGVWPPTLRAHPFARPSPPTYNANGYKETQQAVGHCNPEALQDSLGQPRTRKPGQEQ